MRKQLSATMEDYLEAIAFLQKEKGVVRVKDMSRVLGVTKASVTGALRALAQQGLVVHERYGYVDLTKEGIAIASKVEHCHNTLITFLTNVLALDRNTAQQDACKIEHALSPQTFEKIKMFNEYALRGTQQRPVWLQRLHDFFKSK